MCRFNTIHGFFHKNDQLGAIANTHVAFADQFVDGVRDPACMALARLFSLAVDFPKLVTLPLSRKKFESKSIPISCRKRIKPSYASHRIIGKLFREIKAVMNEEILKILVEDISINTELLVPGYEVNKSDIHMYNHYIYLRRNSLRLLNLFMRIT